MGKKVTALLLALLMVLSMAACRDEDKDGKDSNGKKGDSFLSSDLATDEPTLSEEENTVFYLMMNYIPSESEDYYITVTSSRGEVKAEVNGETHKVAALDPELLFEIEEEMIKAGIMDLVGMDTFDEGDALGSVYMEYTDGKQLMVNFNGSVPEEFLAAYKHMEEYFTKLLKNAPDYVPEARVDGEVDETQLKLLKELLSKSSIEKADQLKISAVAMDEHTAENLGLDSAEFVTVATVCQSTVMEVPYSLTVIKLNSQDNIEALRADLADGLRWDKWVLVPADRALIAQKDGMVLCLIATGENYTNSAKAIADCGWEALTEYKK